ncbi:LysR family transcriptional regulator [Bradyrhizobium sp. SZCCHNRI1009]|uniref:LysR family transcriptional regulator n=1 Tax=Bradyrhizobium sp. SZCCHNRI1009 TaxID=3057277 RepID=UPI0029162858|nr:LysR substrate-binding domain-containing protein [Bradyrhizobium sp. SZCCHNRI1009]
MPLNLRQIEVFRAIMMTGSISGAARLLSVSQPAISRLLAYTEDGLKLKLFERISGRVQPTPEAKRLFAEVEHVHRGVARINDLADELRAGGTGTIRVVASPSAGHGMVPEALSRLRGRFPDLRVEFESLTLLEIVGRVGTARADLGITVLPVDEPTVAVETIAEGALHVIMPADHALTRLRSIRPKDMLPYPLVGFGPQTPYGHIVTSALAGGPEPATIVRYTPDACAMVRAGAGLGVVDEFVLRGHAWPDLAARPLAPKTPMRAYLLTPRFEPLSRNAAALADILRGRDRKGAATKR